MLPTVTLQTNSKNSPKNQTTLAQKQSPLNMKSVPYSRSPNKFSPKSKNPAQNTDPKIEFFKTIKNYEEKFLSENINTYITSIQNLVSDFTNIQKHNIKIQDLNPYNPDKAYKISAENSDQKINPLVLHIKNFFEKNDTIDSFRLEIAQRVFFEYNLSIPRLYQGINWWIEPYIPDSKSDENEYKFLL